MIYFANYLPDSEMPALYMNAAAVLYPTMYEGFGFPAVEAQACGTPGAVQRRRQPRGAGRACGDEFCPPTDKDAWVGACRTLIRERAEAPPHQNDRAREWAASFRGSRTANDKSTCWRQSPIRAGRTPQERQ